MSEFSFRTKDGTTLNKSQYIRKTLVDLYRAHPFTKELEKVKYNGTGVDTVYLISFHNTKIRVNDREKIDRRCKKLINQYMGYIKIEGPERYVSMLFAFGDDPLLESDTLTTRFKFIRHPNQYEEALDIIKRMGNEEKEINKK